MAKRALIPIALLALVASQMLAAVGVVNAAAPAFTVTADRPQSVPKGHLWSFNDFFPRTVTVTSGTTFQFEIDGFHTATLLPTSVTVAQDRATSSIAAPDPDDTGRNPGGTTHTQINPAALMPTSTTCGTTANPCTFDGTAVVSSGVPQAPPPANVFAVNITAPVGTYTFHCRVHPGMQGTLNVVAAGSSGLTTADSASADAASQAAAEVVDARAVEAAANRNSVKKNANGTKTWTITAGTSADDGHVVILEFLPRNVNVHRGDRVVWKPMATNEPHTVTFPRDLFTDQVAVCNAADGKDSPATPNHTPPQGPGDFTCPSGTHLEIEFAPGNGVHVLESGKTVSDSGLLGPRGLPTAFGLPTTAARPDWWVQFASNANRGRYHYVCQIHEGMAATITVVH